MKSINFFSTYIFLAVMVALLTVSGCKKLLDTERQGEYTADNYPYPGGSGPYDQFIFAAYNQLRNFNVHVFAFLFATSIRSDDADKGSTPADGGSNATEMDNFPVTPSNGHVNALWTGYYSLINDCNTTIKEVNTNTDIDASDAIKQQTIGEARFIRGYAYFMLVRLFGRVPLIDTLFSDPALQNNILQSSSAELYNFIENDLNFAVANLPASWDPKFVGRATSGAAQGMLAKVYLTQKKWGLAMNAAQAIMNSGQYGFANSSGNISSYDLVFREVGENSRESIFEVQGTASATQPTANGIQYTQVQSVRGPGEWNFGWGFNTPSQALADAYEPGDPRRARTILFTSTATTPGVTMYGEVTPVGLPNPRYNQKVYTDPAIKAAVGSRSGWWMNIRILRYADVVLMFAEAANEVGGAENIAAAKAALNSVRARARAGNAGILPDVTTNDQSELRLAIHHERRIELAMEHDRFFDLVRWGKAQAALHAVGKTNFNENRDILLPIPQVQIDLSQGKLTQNPLY
ncbi:MAG: RagB/SusD family nutrient uptake outer membrane protein [Chitinophagaceae bacterium]